MNFCEILHEFLKDNDMTQRLFAERVGGKQTQVSEWLRGKAQPGYDTLKRISLAFHISADYFLGTTEIY